MSVGKGKESRGQEKNLYNIYTYEALTGAYVMSSIDISNPLYSFLYLVACLRVGYILPMLSGSLVLFSLSPELGLFQVR